MSASSLLQLVDKTSDWDKDERYMAANDLCNLLSRDVKIDEHVEQRICAAILKLLDDSSNDVQSVAVKCLAVLVKKVHQNQIGEICKKLSDLVIAGQSTLRDIYSIGLKTLINDVPDSMGLLVANGLGAKLLNGIIHGSSDDSKRECLENMFELLKRFGHLMESHHSGVVSALLDVLKSPKAPLRKRAINCLGAFAVVANDALLNDLMSQLLNRIQELNFTSAGTSQESRTIIQTIGNLSRNVGYRLGRYLDQIVPLFVTFCGDPSDEAGHTEAANDLRESCFPGLESFVLRCPKEVVPHLPAIMDVAIVFSKYDPNYMYDSDNEGGNSGDEDYEDFGDEDYAGSEEDDGSWKVRKAAVKVIDAIIITHSQRMSSIFTTCADELLSRFKEREENVKIDIIRCYSHLLQVNSVSANASSQRREEQPHFGAFPLIRQTSLGREVQSRADRIVAASMQQLQGRSIKAKTEILSMLNTLVISLQGGLERHLPKLFSATERLLREKTQTLKLEALQFLRIACVHHQVADLQPMIQSLLPLAIQNTREDGFKTVPEALCLIAELIKIMRPSVVVDDASNSAMDVSGPSYAFEGHVQPIYEAISSRLAVQDLDLEIKLCAIHAMGVCVSYFGDHLQAVLPSVFAVFQKRLENESSRIATLKAIQKIAKSSLGINLSAFLAATVTNLAFFCKQYSRSLKTLTLHTLTVIVANPATEMDGGIYETIVKEVGPLISDSDLYVGHLSISLVLQLYRRNAQVSTPLIVQHVYPKLISMATSSLTQGMTLDSLIQLLKALVTSHDAAFSFNDLFNQLYNVTDHTAEGNKQSLSNISKCIAGICSVLDANELQATLQGCVQDIYDNLSNESRSGHVVLALLCVGEVGQSADLSHLQNLSSLLLQCFDHPSEDVKHAAAYALGHVAVGNMPAFLPLILSSLTEATHVRTIYLLLLSLKENIVLYKENVANYEEHVNRILPILIKMTAQHEDDSIRNILSDCLGILTTLSLRKLLPVLTDIYNTNADNKFMLWIVASALKSCFARPLSDEQIADLHDALPTFFPLLRNADLDVKKAALLMANTAIHHNPSVIATHVLKYVYPVLTDTLLIKLERVVDLGPFKHKVDDNLPLRKICLACLETILTTLPERFDANSLLHISTQLLNDHEDVKLLYLQVLPRICEVNGSAVAVNAEDMIPALEGTLAKAAKEMSDNLTGSKEILKAVVRFVFRVDKIDEVKQVSRKWTEFSSKVRKAESIAEIVRAVEHDSLELH